jgi:uncharacterized protein (UPF0248 family)
MWTRSERCDAAWLGSAKRVLSTKAKLVWKPFKKQKDRNVVLRHRGSPVGPHPYSGTRGHLFHDWFRLVLFRHVLHKVHKQFAVGVIHLRQETAQLM